MPSKIFVNYRRDDDAAAAARVRDGLAARFGKANVFMDVDNLLAGQRFDVKLAEALDACDVLIAVIGERWMGILRERAAAIEADPDERDYVREEIAAALKRGVVVIPVRVGRDGKLPPLPRPSELPADIRELVAHQKHDVRHETHGRDIADLIEAIQTVRREKLAQQPRRMPWPWVGATAAVAFGIGSAAAYFGGVPMPWSSTSAIGPDVIALEQTRAADQAADAKQKLEARAKAEAEAKRLADLAAQERRDREAKDKAAAEAAARAKASEEQRQKEAAEAKRRADEEARRRDPVAALTPGSGQSARDCPECPEMVVVPAGSFTMGSPANEPGRDRDEGPQRTVTIRQPFAVGKFEVTFAEWDACVAGGGCRHKPETSWGRGRQPVLSISWDDAKQYVTWLSAKTGKTYRLLSEAEWEYAARAGTTTRYFWGDTFSDARANNDKGRTVEVGQYGANAWGLHDMHGNVWEWVEDCWHDSYNGAPTDGSAWTTACTDGGRRVLRGGSWLNTPRNLRSAVRSRYSSDSRFGFLGFRVGRTF